MAWLKLDRNQHKIQAIPPRSYQDLRAITCFKLLEKWLGMRERIKATQQHEVKTVNTTTNKPKLPEHLDKTLCMIHILKNGNVYTKYMQMWRRDKKERVTMLKRDNNHKTGINRLILALWEQSG